MTYKDADRRKAFWVSFTYIIISPIMVHYGLNQTAVESSVMALTGLGVANYFSKPTGS